MIQSFFNPPSSVYPVQGSPLVTAALCPRVIEPWSEGQKLHDQYCIHICTAVQVTFLIL
jgi:hypothetical protein